MLIHFVSCTSSKSEKTETTPSAELAKNDDTLSDKNLIVTFDAEINLKTQLDRYITAYNNEDAKTVMSYLYPDLFEYIQRATPDENINSFDFENEIVIKPVEKIKKRLKGTGVKYHFEIGEITNKVDYNESKIYTVIIYLVMTKDFKKTSSGDKIIAISLDNGENWKFMQKDEEMSKQILLMKFPKDIVETSMK